MDLHLDGRAAIVTGASGGIGSAIAQVLVEEGAHVFGSYFKGNERATQLTRESEGQISMDYLDLREEESVARFMDNIASARDAEIYGLVNCAGTASFGPTGKFSVSEWDGIQNVNLRGAFLMTRAVVPFMRAGGSVINISSMAARAGSFEGAAYASSKGGLDALTHSLALELAQDSIRVLGIAPGRIETRFRRQAQGEYPTRMLEDTPMKRLGRPREVAELVAFMLSDKCAFLTGETIYVTGGLQNVWLKHVVPDAGAPPHARTTSFSGNDE